MIFTFLFYILSLFLGNIVIILPTWTLWPNSLLTGITYFASSMAKLNFIFPIDSLFSVILFIINFEVLYFLAKLIMKIFNYVRGTGSGLDI
jgi:hypothetical protein